MRLLLLYEPLDLKNCSMYRKFGIRNIHPIRRDVHSLRLTEARRLRKRS